MAKQVLIGLFCFFFLNGCATAIKPGAEHVRVVQGNVSSDCRWLGSVEGSFSGTVPSESYKGARNKMINQTYDMGGNLVNLEGYYENLVYVTGRGEAYYCANMANSVRPLTWEQKQQRIQAKQRHQQNQQQALQNAQKNADYFSREPSSEKTQYMKPASKTYKSECKTKTVKSFSGGTTGYETSCETN